MIDQSLSDIKLTDNTIVFLQNSIKNFDIQKLKVNISGNEDNYFQLLYSYSFDKTNYTDFVFKSNFVNPDTLNLFVYIAIQCKKNNATDLQKPITLHQQANVKNSLSNIIIDSISYDNIEINIRKEDECKFQSIYEIINQFPRWNFYDGQQITINRWLQQCNAIAESYGHTCIYFKTEPIESTTLHTFRNHVFRNTVDIKKLHILFPGNELGQFDKIVYTDWDQPLQDDFVCHVVVQKFEQAFGENKIPNEKDYLYIPLINKIFRVATSQPKNSFMGKIGWWEVYLAKFEDDETVLVDPALKSSMESTGLFSEELDSQDIFDNSLSSHVFQELQEFKNDTLLTKKENDLITVEEKKSSNQNYTNKLVDSTFHVSLKETEKLREFYDNRLKIVSINPDTSSYPITMYDNSTVEKRTVAMQYNLGDYSTKNKFSLTVANKFSFSFNYVLLNNFVGELFDLLSNDVVLFTIANNRNKIEINNIQIAFNFLPREIYNIIFEYTLSINQIAIKIFSLKNKEKSIEYQNIYTNNTNLVSFLITHIQMFGGNFYSNEIIYTNNQNIILKDYTNPLLVM